MEMHLQKNEIALYYSPKFREYGIKYMDGGTSIQLIKYCPWCGKILPKDLRNEWFNIIENMNFDPNDPLIPIKFLSEEWWRDLNEKNDK